MFLLPSTLSYVLSACLLCSIYFVATNRRLQAVALVARNVPFLSGRVLIQVSLRHLDDKAAIVAQCREYAASFAELGVPTDRYAIKLPFSGAAAAAARTLKDEGIATLATSVFCMEQAVAASQAGCVMISPYYNGEFCEASGV